ncbi:MAG: hypothetical protein MZV63_64595 [Marinilabiliales bacterium]|nr:hypothetical protein [Marinilabiliales bacterium]
MTDTVTFANMTNGSGTTTRPVALTISAPGALSVTPTGAARFFGDGRRPVHAVEPGLHRSRTRAACPSTGRPPKPRLGPHCRPRPGPWPSARRPRSRSRSTRRPTRWLPGPTPTR